MMEKAEVSALAVDKSEVRMTVADLPAEPGSPARVLEALSKHGVPTDMILQAAPGPSSKISLSFMTPRAALPKARQALAEAAGALKGRVDTQDHVAKLSVIGTGFRHQAWVAGTMFRTLAANKIDIHLISSSDLRISVVVDARHAETAMRALHTAYGLAKRSRR